MEDDFKKRLEIEGVLGIAKTKFGLSKLMTKLSESQKASIKFVFYVMNLNQVLLLRYFQKRSKRTFSIDFNDIEMLTKKNE